MAKPMTPAELYGHTENPLYRGYKNLRQCYDAILYDGTPGEVEWACEVLEPILRNIRERAGGE